MIDKRTAIDIARGYVRGYEIDPAYVEKDHYVHQALQRAVDYANRAESIYQLAFGGGTNLSKGHGLIRRFSEDIDLVAYRKDGTDDVVERGPGFNRHMRERKQFREGLIAAISDAPELSASRLGTGGNREWAELSVAYPSRFESPALRPAIRVDLVFKKPVFEPTVVPIRTMASERWRYGAAAATTPSRSALSDPSRRRLAK